MCQTYKRIDIDILIILAELICFAKEYSFFKDKTSSLLQYTVNVVLKNTQSILLPGNVSQSFSVALQSNSHVFPNITVVITEHPRDTRFRSYFVRLSSRTHLDSNSLSGIVVQSNIKSSVQ